MGFWVWGLKFGVWGVRSASDEVRELLLTAEGTIVLGWEFCVYIVGFRILGVGFSV